jgi:hypothetical protein
VGEAVVVQQLLVIGSAEALVVQVAVEACATMGAAGLGACKGLAVWGRDEDVAAGHAGHLGQRLREDGWGQVLDDLQGHDQVEAAVGERETVTDGYGALGVGVAQGARAGVDPDDRPAILYQRVRRCAVPAAEVQDACDITRHEGVAVAQSLEIGRVGWPSPQG